MKKILLCASLVLLACLTVDANQSDAERLDAVSALIESVKRDPSFSGDLFPDSSIDGALSVIPSFRHLEMELASIGSIPSLWVERRMNYNDREAQVVFVHALAKVSAEQYLEVGYNLLAKLQRGEIDKSTFAIGYLMPSNSKQWFFSSNYRSPMVVQYLKVVADHFKGDRDVTGWVNDVLTGKLAKRDSILRRESAALSRDRIDWMKDIPDEVERRRGVLDAANCNSAEPNSRGASEKTSSGKLVKFGLAALVIAVFCLGWLRALLKVPIK